MHGWADNRHVQKDTDALRYDNPHVLESLLGELIRELPLSLNVFEVAQVTQRGTRPSFSLHEALLPLLILI